MNDNESSKKEIDKFSGVETTGHEWDGLKELNNPLPRWWLWIFYISIIWSIGYWVVYPAWPTLSGNTKGTFGYTQYKELKASQKEITERQAAYLEKFEGAGFEEILNDPALYSFAVSGGAASFKDNCATCHGIGAEGFKGYPNLNDDDWLWGGTIEDISYTLHHGIRADNYDTRISEMPAFGRDGLLKREEINAVVDYVEFLNSGEKTQNFEAGQVVFEQQCTSCHGADGKGLREFGAPNLTDEIWLYGSGRASIYETIYNGRAGMMPAWKGRLDENTIKQLAIYLHQLGGGE